MSASARPQAPMPPPLAAAWQAEALEAALDAQRPGLRVEVVAEADSTNTRLIERARQGDAGPALLVAERQTAGRGRMGRTWWSQADASASVGAGLASLTFSLGLPFAPRAWSGLSLAVGVAVAEALDPVDPSGATGEPRIRLKWPNDLWLGATGRKFGGVLIETIAAQAPAAEPTRHVVIGIGLNLDTPPAQAGIAQPTAGWREAEPQADAPALLARVAPALLAMLTEFEHAGFAAFAARYARRDALAGRPIEVSAVPPWAGRADGIDDDGALRLVTPEGRLRRIDSAEVSVRPSC